MSVISKNILSALSLHNKKTFMEYNGVRYSYRMLACKMAGIAASVNALPYRPAAIIICVQNPLLHCAAMFYSAVSGVPYVPVDKGLPEQRVSMMLGTLSGDILVCVDKKTKKIFHDDDVKILDISELDSETPLSNISSPAPDSLQYIIFTSGSTGVPKGAAVYNESFNNTLSWYRQIIDPQPGERCLIVSSLSFDLTQKNIFIAMMNGCVLHFVDELVFDPQNICDQISRFLIKWINCAPSAFSLFVENLPKEKLATVHSIVLGGEAINSQTLLQLRSEGVKTRFINSYGPTECADVAFYHEISDEDLQSGRIPIGKPIPGITFEIFYEDEQKSSGELILKGVCVGAGYINNEDATKKSFLTLTAEGIPQRAYRTGDIVSELPDGTLTFVSRTDDQIKYRGNRIELGEIERAFRDIKEIKEVVAKLVDEELIVFAVLYNSQPQNDPNLISMLRKEAALTLPAYSIPTRIVFLQEFPLNNSGKIDRKALTALLPAAERTSQLKTFTHMTIDALRGILGTISVSSITSNDGETLHSLNSLEVVALTGVLRQLAEPPIKVRDIMTVSSLDTLAKKLVFKRSIHLIRCFPVGMDISSFDKCGSIISGKNGKIQIVTDDESFNVVIGDESNKLNRMQFPCETERKRIEVLSPTCKGIFFESVTEGKSSAYNIPLVIQCETSSNINKMLEQFVGLINEQEILRSKLHFSDGVLSYELCQTLTKDELVTMSDIFQSVTQEGLIQAIDKPFELYEGYLFRVLLLENNVGATIIFIFHHVIIDGLSLGLIRDKLLFSDDNTVILPPCTLEDYYKYCSVSFKYNKNILDQKVNELSLNSTEEVSSSDLHPEFQHILRIRDEDILRVREWCRGHNLSVASWFFSMAIVCYQKVSGRIDFNVLFPNANRTIPQVSNVIGCLVNSSLITVRLKSIHNFSELCRYVSEELIADILDYPNIPLSAFLARKHVNIAFLFTAVNHQRPALTSYPGEIYNPRPRANCGIEVQEYDDCVEVIFNGYGHPETLRFIDSLMKSLSNIEPTDFPVSIEYQTSNAKGNLPLCSPNILFNKISKPDNNLDDVFYRRFDAVCNSIFGARQHWSMPKRDTSLFEYGLDSLMAINLVARINSEFNVRYSLKQLFKDKTFAGVVDSLKLMKNSSEHEIRTIPMVHRLYPSQLSLLQRDIIIPGERENIISVALLFNNKVDVSSFTHHFNSFLEAHPELFIGEECERSQVCSSFCVHHHGKVYADENDAALIHVIDALTWDAFEPKKEVLFRPHIFRLQGGNHLLYCIFHHAVWDGGSAELFFSFVENSLNDGMECSSVPVTSVQGRDRISAQESLNYYRSYFKGLANDGINISHSTFKRRIGKSIYKVISDKFDFKQIDLECRKRGFAFSLRCAWDMCTLTQRLGFCGFSNMIDKRLDYGAEGKMAYLVEPLPFFLHDNFSFEEFVTLYYSHLGHLSSSMDDLMLIAEECGIKDSFKEMIEVRLYFQTHWKDISLSGKYWRESCIDNHIPWDVVNCGLSIYFNINNDMLSLECRFNDDFVNEQLLVKEVDALAVRLRAFLSESARGNILN